MIKDDKINVFIDDDIKMVKLGKTRIINDD